MSATGPSAGPSSRWWSTGRTYPRCRLSPPMSGELAKLLGRRHEGHAAPSRVRCPRPCRRPRGSNLGRTLPEREDLERRATELLQQLIRFNTVNPPGNEEEAQRFLAGLLGDAGFETELLADVEGRPNLVARLAAGSDGPGLVLLGHVDTVLADPADWSTDPWSGEVKDEAVWGRGALDMKSQVAAEIAAAVALAEEGWRPEAGELKIIVTADEEAG